MTATNGLYIVETTITTSATPNYADHDQIGTVVTLGDVFSSEKKAVLESVAVVDKAAQGPAITLLFFDASPTVASSDNAALNITDAELADKFCGKVEVATGDYQATAAAHVATVNGIGLVVNGTKASADLYLQVESAGAYNAAGTSDLVLRLGFRRQ